MKVISQRLDVAKGNPKYRKGELIWQVHLHSSLLYLKLLQGFWLNGSVKRGIQWGVTAITAAELGTLAIESAEGLAEYKKALAEAEKILKDLAEKIKKEIDLNIDSKLEVQVLLRLQGADNQSLRIPNILKVGGLATIQSKPLSNKKSLSAQ